MSTIHRLVHAGMLVAALIVGNGVGAGEVPKFEVDPFWPKPLPNNWTLGQVAGVAVDERDHVWIMQRPRSLRALRERRRARTRRASQCCVPAPPVIEFDPEGNVVQAWGGPGAGYEWPEQRAWHPRRPDALSGSAATTRTTAFLNSRATANS